MSHRAALTLLPSILLLGSFLMPLPSVAQEAESGAGAEQPVEEAKAKPRLVGTFVWDRRLWNKDIDGAVEAVLTPTSDGRWSADFHFNWGGEDRVWKGKVWGNLTNGKLEGQAQEDRDPGRTFTFEGTMKDGRFSGEHYSIEEDGDRRRRGTIKFRHEP